MNVQKPKLTKQEKYAAKREEVFRAAARVFARLGYHQASINDVADELGITAAALYYYVKSKDELYVSTSDVVLADLSTELAVILARTELSGLEKLRSYFRFHANYITDDFGRCLILSGRFGAIRDDKAKTPSHIMDGKIREVIAEAIDDGSLKPCDPMLLSQMLFGAINTLARWWVPKKRLTADQAADQMFTMMVEGIGTGS